MERLYTIQTMPLGSSPEFYAFGEVRDQEGKKVLYNAIESTRLGAFMAVAWQLAVAGYIKK